MQAITTIGLDIAKSVFQVHAVDAKCNVVLRLIIPMTIGEGLETGKQFELRITEDAARELYTVLKERLGL